MFAWISQPSERKHHHQRNSNKNSKSNQSEYEKQDLKDEIAIGLPPASAPELADTAFTGNDAVKEDKTHSAADVDKSDEKNQHENDEQDYCQDCDWTEDSGSLQGLPGT